MKIKTIYFLLAAVIISACERIEATDKLSGTAIIVDNFKNNMPLEGIYIEVEYAKDESAPSEIIASTTTDKNGFFEINERYASGLLNLDSWLVAHVYKDAKYSDTLGEFGFQFPKNTFRYKTIHLDTFSMPYNIWVIPRISTLSNLQPDEITIEFFNCEVVDAAQKNITHSGTVSLNQTFTPAEIKMTMNMQHWLMYGSKEIAKGTLKKGGQTIGFGHFKLEETKRTVEGDTLYLDFDVADIQ